MTYIVIVNYKLKYFTERFILSIYFKDIIKNILENLFQ